METATNTGDTETHAAEQDETRGQDEVARQTEERPRALGARMICGVSYAGEDPRFTYTPQASTYPNYPA